MVFKKFSTFAFGLTILLALISLCACRKKLKYTIRIITNDSATASFWSLYPPNQALDKQKVVKLTNNPNDAEISNVNISYIDGKGHNVEDNYTEYFKKHHTARFIREYKIVPGTKVTVIASARQTGKVFTEEPNKEELLTGGKKAGDATVILKVEILKDGTIFGGNYKTGKPGEEVKLTMVGNTIDNN